MKKSIYVLACGLLGLIISTIIHGVVEIAALQLIFYNPECFAETLWWTHWKPIHDSLSLALWLIGLLGGLFVGYKWWGPYGSKPGFYHWRRRLER
jgi:hypothetical protein